MRKLIMTVLTLALILGSISMASAASDKVRLTDIAGNINEEAIQVAVDLEIVEGTPEGAYEPEKAVNRAEFAALIVRALKVPESALASYSTTTFKDAAGYQWAVPYLAILQQRGIMKGDGYGNAMPGRTISPNEAVTMVLRAVGYTDNASVLVGQWPANYVALGQNQNLYASVANDLQMNKASAAQMIYNALTVQLVQVDANSTVSYLWDRIGSAGSGNQAKRTLLTTGLNCYADNDGDRKVVTFDDTSKSKINLVPRVGAYGVLWKSKADGEVVALTDVTTEFLAGRFYRESNGTVKFESVDGTRYNLNDNASWARRVADENYTDETTSHHAFFLNGDVVDIDKDKKNYYFYDFKWKDTAHLTKKADGNGSSFLIVAANVNGLTFTELRSVAIWDAARSGYGDNFLYEAGMFDENSNKFNGHSFPLDANNARDDYGYQLGGVDSLEDIKADNVVYIYKNGSKIITRIDVGTGTQSGTVTNINAPLSTIGGKMILWAPWLGLGFGDAKVGNEGTAFLDVYGRLYDFRLGEASKGNFAVWLAAGGDNFTWDTNTQTQVKQYKLFDKTGAEVVYGKTSSALVDDTTITTDDPGKEPLTAPKYTIPYVSIGSVGRLVEYGLSGGKLRSLVYGLMAENSVTDTNSDGKFGVVNKAGTIIRIKDTDYLIDSSTVVYVYTDDKAGDTGHTNDYTDVSLGSIKDLLDGKLSKPFQYFLDSDGKIKALLVNSIDAGTTNVFVMINNISSGWDNGDIDVVSGLNFDDGVSNAYYVKNYVDAALRTGSIVNDISKKNSMFKFRIDENGVLKDVKDLKTENGSVAIIKAALYDIPYNAGTGGTFNLIVTEAAISGTTLNLPTASDINGNKIITFEANTVLYNLEGYNWVAYRPTTGNLKDEGGLQDLYVFLKTDTDKAYDVIIRVQQ
ncbi:MAG: S-layer homology domain-containing protein [Clostridiales Family XIII bacterium]|jgi:hypothetical protein|nr:S-layer homology domain-containing protein [Clostridiales Family XIII bacterium]